MLMRQPCSEQGKQDSYPAEEFIFICLSKEEALEERISHGVGECYLGSRALGRTADPVTRRKMSATLSILEGNYLQRRSDPRLFRLSRNLVRCAVIFDVVAFH